MYFSLELVGSVYLVNTFEKGGSLEAVHVVIDIMKIILLLLLIGIGDFGEEKALLLSGFECSYSEIKNL